MYDQCSRSSSGRSPRALFRFRICAAEDSRIALVLVPGHQRPTYIGDAPVIPGNQRVGLLCSCPRPQLSIRHVGNVSAMAVTKSTGQEVRAGLKAACWGQLCEQSENPVPRISNPDQQPDRHASFGAYLRLHRGRQASPGVSLRRSGDRLTQPLRQQDSVTQCCACLLYTSDAADE